MKDLHFNVQILNQSRAAIGNKKKTEAFAISKKDKHKIVKLFQHSSWDQFMKWVNDKLLESG
jgi:hypothetical protein